MEFPITADQADDSYCTDVRREGCVQRPPRGGFFMPAVPAMIVGGDGPDDIMVDD
jgi:hypothetical protein